MSNYRGYNVISNDEKEIVDHINDADLEVLRRNGFELNENHIIGRGRYGTVYEGIGNSRARWVSRGSDGCDREESLVGQRVVIKYIYLKDDVLKAGKNELRIISQLRHPNVIDVYDSYLISERRVYIIMELSTDGTLYRFLHDCDSGVESMTEELCVSFIQQLTDGLLYLHDQHVGHHDIKGFNVVVFKNYTKQDDFMIGKNTRRIVLKYVDFGLAEIVGRKLGFDVPRLANLSVAIASRLPFDSYNYYKDVSNFMARGFKDLREAILHYRFLHPPEHERLMSGKFYRPPHWLRSRARHPEWYISELPDLENLKNLPPKRMPYRRSGDSLPSIHTTRPIARTRSESALNSYSLPPYARTTQTDVEYLSAHHRPLFRSQSLPSSSTKFQSLSRSQSTPLMNYRYSSTLRYPMEEWMTDMDDYPFDLSSDSEQRSQTLPQFEDLPPPQTYCDLIDLLIIREQNMTVIRFLVGWPQTELIYCRTVETPII